LKLKTGVVGYNLGVEKILEIIRGIVSFIFPPDPLTRELETMTFSEFAKKVRQIEFIKSPSTLAIGSYHDPLVRQAVWELKYRDNPKISSLLGQLIYEELFLELSEEKIFGKHLPPILIPIPLSAKRLRERGFNQIEVLCEKIKKLDRENLLDYQPKILVKTRNTPPQTKISRQKRLANLTNCFAVKFPEKIVGRKIILLDDVLTTGATITEARRTLLASDAKSVTAITVAH